MYSSMYTIIPGTRNLYAFVMCAKLLSRTDLGCVNAFHFSDKCLALIYYLPLPKLNSLPPVPGLICTPSPAALELEPSLLESLSESCGRGVLCMRQVHG